MVYSTPFAVLQSDAASPIENVVNGCVNVNINSVKGCVCWALEEP